MNPHPEFGLGLVIGKFLPPHRGHEFLIATACERSHQVVVIVCGKPSDPVPPETRAEWLRELAPRAEVMVIEDRYDENDSRVWAENTRRWLGRAPEAVFTSEAYGDPFAAHLGCRHVSVDPGRSRIPCSGTMLRADPFGGWEFLSPPVRAWYARRVVVAGAESTGTTTLASDLAAALGTNWVPEFGREYSEQKLRRGEMEWNSAEFVAIAAEQTRLENQAAREANRILVCDTNAFATVLWHRRYLGRDHPPLQEAASRCVSHLYILTGDEIPFVQDGLRDGEHIRHEMHRWFLTALTGQSSPWLPVQGSRQERLSAALRACRNILGWPREATPGAG